MRKKFYTHLVNHGYSVTTPSGRPSTVPIYIDYLEDVIRREWLGDWNGLAANIFHLIPLYDNGGCKEDLGQRKHRSCISAMKAFANFVRQQRYSSRR